MSHEFRIKPASDGRFVRTISRARTHAVPIMAAAAIIAACERPPARPQDDVARETEGSEARVSRLGQYEGYSDPQYDGYERNSVYLPTRDGTRLAIDIYRPTLGGVVEDQPLPCIWTHTRYTSAKIRDGKVNTIANTWRDVPGWQLPKVISYGYVAASVDVRGSGASFGERRDYFPPEEARDAYDVTEWLAEQPWCDGNIGMYGLSYLGITQLFAAAEAPPHLKAIFPAMAFVDSYEVNYPGGVYAGRPLEVWGRDWNPPPDVYADQDAGIAAVDADTDRKLLTAARREHQKGWNFNETLRAAQFRDSGDPTGAPFHIERSPISRYEDISRWGGAIYYRTGWFDGYTTGPFFMNASLDNPQKMVIGPWFHAEYSDLAVDIEHVRWFDYWLKGIDNGIMDEPAVHYYLMGAPKDEAWRSTRIWPREDQVETSFYFSAMPAGSIDSLNDGSLADAKPSIVSTSSMQIDYAATAGEYGRLLGSIRNDRGRSCSVDECGLDRGYTDLSATMDARSLTFTTPPMAEDTEITGHPVVYLSVSSTHPDADVLVYLEEVHPDGFSQYVSEGKLRLSHRMTADPPYNRLGLPWHPSREADVAPLPVGQIAELALDLMPMANIFDRGNRIRVTISGADSDTVEPVRYPSTPTLIVHHGGESASRIVLPVIPPPSNK